MFIQLYRLVFAKKTSPRIYTSTPGLQTFKTFLVLVQIVLCASLYELNKSSYFIGSLATVLLAFVVELVEFRRSPVAIASLLLYWLINTVFSFGVFIQDSYSKHKIYANSGPAYLIEIVGLVNSLAILSSRLAFSNQGLRLPMRSFWTLSICFRTSRSTTSSRLLIRYMRQTM